MAQQFIDVGTRINDGNGDSLRAGAQKINANFTELYAALGTGVFEYITAGQGIAIDAGSGTISLSNNISAPGAITAASNLSTTGQLFVKWVDSHGAIRDGAAILPGLNGDPAVSVTKRYDIGATDKQFRDIYSQRLLASGAISAGSDVSSSGVVYVRASDEYGNVAIGSTILPGLATDANGDVNDKYDIGSSLRRFRTTYSDLVGNVTGNVTGNVIGVVTGGLRANAPIVLANITTGVRDSLTNVGQGALIYNATTFRLQFWNGVTWGELATTAAPDASTLVGTTLATGVVNSSLTTLGTLTSLAVSGATTVSGTINANGGIATSQTTFNLVNSTATTVNFAGAATSVAIGASTGTTTVNNDLTVIGNLTVNGTTTTINSTTYTVDDKNIELASVNTPTDVTADGAGITIKGATDKTILWDTANANFTSSEHLNLVTGKKYKINNVDVLTSTALGTTVVGSSLTSVGTLTSLTVSGTIAANGSSGITTTQTTFPLVNTTATTVNFAGAATAIAIGASTGTTTINNNATIIGNTLIGAAASANFTRFPNANVVISNTSNSIQKNESHNIGLMAEGTANASNTSIYGIGVYGAGYTNGATRSGGVVGEGHVAASTDTGSSIGVRGYANDTHTGGANIGLYGDASNSSTANYSLYLNNGDIYVSNAKTVYLNGDLTFNGAYSVIFSGAVNAASSVTSFFATPNGTLTAFAAATSLTVGGAATTVSIGASSGTASINNATLTLGNATTININGASPSLVTSSTGTVSLFNTNATTINIGGAATAVAIGSSTSTTTLQNVKHNGIEITPANYITVSGTSTYVLSTTVTNNILIVTNTGYTANLTFPASPVDGQVLKFTVTTNGCTLGLTAGPTLVGTFAGAVSAPAAYTYIYRNSNSTWYRVL